MAAVTSVTTIRVLPDLDEGAVMRGSRLLSTGAATVLLTAAYTDVDAAYPDWKPVANEGTNGRGHARVPGGADEGCYE